LRTFQGTALHEGLQWDWETFPEFSMLSSRRDYDVRYKVLRFPMLRLRVNVIGERALLQESPRVMMRSTRWHAWLLKARWCAGRWGSAPPRRCVHQTRRGEITPLLRCRLDELTVIARAIGKTGAGVLQLVADFIDTSTDLDMVARMLRVSGRPMSFIVVQQRDRPEQYRRESLDFLVRMNAARISLAWTAFRCRLDDSRFDVFGHSPPILGRPTARQGL